MNVTNFSNLFHQNSIFQQNKPLGQKLVQPSVSDTLNRLSKNLINAQKQTKDLKNRFDTLELSLEAAESKKTSAVEEMPEGLLHFYLNQCKVGANLSQQHEASLLEYRNQLSAFDQTIQEYQDMLDGKAALPEQMKLKDAAGLLEATKAAREQFLRQGAAALNRVSDNNPTQTGYMGKAYGMAAEWTGNGQNDTHWQIDASAKNIYDEIDRAITSAHSITSTFQKGASSILSELKRRGCVEEGEEIHYEDQNTAGSTAVERESLFQSIYDEIWNAIFTQNSGAEEKLTSGVGPVGTADKR